MHRSFYQIDTFRLLGRGVGNFGNDVIDAVDGIVALGWEVFDFDSEERPVRVAFHFGEELASVTDKLATKGLRLINEEIKFKLK